VDHTSTSTTVTIGHHWSQDCHHCHHYPVPCTTATVPLSQLPRPLSSLSVSALNSNSSMWCDVM
jgi:hypothetical protein